MRRADRLFQLVQLLRKSRLITAQRIAEVLEVSERTVYRDIRDLCLCGVPIRGEAGVGYALERGFDLPPLMFTEEELEALVLGARIVQSHGDPSLAKAADSVMAKVELVLPPRLRAVVTTSTLLAPSFHPGRAATHLGAVREGLRTHRRLHFRYEDKQARASARTVRPLGIAFWGKVWSVAAWCEDRADFRSFRVDRMEEVTLGTPFEADPERGLEAFIRNLQRQGIPQQG